MRKYGYYKIQCVILSVFRPGHTVRETFKATPCKESTSCIEQVPGGSTEKAVREGEGGGLYYVLLLYSCTGAL